MKITQIAAYQVDLPLAETYYMSGGRYYESLYSTIVSVSTDDGVVGWGESCPFGHQVADELIEAVTGLEHADQVKAVITPLATGWR